VTRWYSVWASRIAVGRSIFGWTAREPGQVVVVVMIMSYSFVAED
jgi:hypothetical protein